MKKILPFLAIFLLFANCTAQESKVEISAQKFNKKLADSLGADERGMKNYMLVILKTGPKDAAITDKKEREKLFEAFMRGSNSQNKTGSGLGLRIVKRILEYHKSEISYSSDSDKENLFTVIFNK